MPFELRLPGREPRRFEAEEDAVAAAREALLADADAEPEVIDLETGQPAAPGASAGWREDLAKRTGF